MMTIGFLVSLAGSMTALVAVRLTALAPVGAALTLGPIWLGSIAVAHRMLEGHPVGIRAFLGEVRRQARSGAALAAAPAVVAALLLASISIREARPAQRWLLIPIALDATVLIVLLFGCLFVFPLAVMTDLHGRERWLVALSLAGRDLVRTLGMAAILVLLAESARLTGPLLAVLLAGPLAVLCAAATHRAIEPSSLGSRT